MNAQDAEDTGFSPPAELRRQAEQRLRAGAAFDDRPRTDSDVRALLHELQVHQIELEMQNEELQRAHTTAQEASERYYELFDFAPVGYYVWDHEGCIVEVNLAGAELLGLNRKALVQKRFGEFVSLESRPAFAEFCRKVLAFDAQQHCEITLVKNGQPVVVLVEGIAAQQRQEQGKRCCAAVIDITPQRRAKELSEANRALEAEILARKQTEAALSASEDRLRSLIEQASDGIFVSDPEGRYVDVNSVGCQMLGYLRQEILGLSIADVIDVEERPRLALQFDRLRRGETIRNEWQFRRKDGSLFFGEVSAKQLSDGRFQAFVRDITDRKRAEQQLFEMNQLLQAVMHAVPVGVSFSDDPTCQRITGNPTLFEQFEVTAYDNVSASAPDPSAAGRQVRFFREGRPVPAAELPLQRAVTENKMIAPMELEILLPSGRRWFADSSAAPLHDRQGNVIGGVGVCMDVTQRKRVEEALRASERFQAAVLNSLASHIAVLDQNGIITAVNEPWVRFARENVSAEDNVIGVGANYLEVTRAAALGNDPYAVAALEGIEAVLQGRQRQFVIEYPCSAPGQERWFLMHVTANAAEIGGAIVTHTNITQQKCFEEELSRAKEAAEAANLAKSRFLANMSHELRTPMNAILGMIDVALPKAVDPVVLDCLQTAKESADLLLTLLNDLLDSAKIESGKLDLELAPFSLRQMLEQTTRSLSVRAAEKGLSFACRMPDDIPPTVMGDRTRLQQVLLNLAGNAIKFTNNGEVEIGVRTFLEEDEACLEFAVRDTGIGIPPADLERIFEPFAQGDVSISRRFGGTGLGLAISKNLVELMGGRIWAESDEGRGSTFAFSVRLPLASELSPESKLPAVVSLAACSQLQILIVEDNPANQKLAAYVLRDRGHCVEFANDGHEALRAVQQKGFDVILMDVQMPGLDGLQATAAIREQEAGGSRVPIIAMTAYAQKGDRERCLATGMDAYLSKPVSREELIGLVERLGAKGDAGSAEPSLPEAEAVPTSIDKVPCPRSDGSTSSCFNLDEALARIGSMELFREMVVFLFRDGLQLVKEMHAAAGSGDLKTVEVKAHRLHGTLLYVGAEAASRAVSNVESLARYGDLADAARAIRMMDVEVTRLMEALRGFGPADK